MNRNIRGLAWIVLRWAGTVRPRVIILENVEEFVTWGPVRKGKPIKKKPVRRSNSGNDSLWRWAMTWNIGKSWRLISARQLHANVLCWWHAVMGSPLYGRYGRMRRGQ